MQTNMIMQGVHARKNVHARKYFHVKLIHVYARLEHVHEKETCSYKECMKILINVHLRSNQIPN